MFFLSTRSTSPRSLTLGEGGEVGGAVEPCGQTGSGSEQINGEIQVEDEDDGTEGYVGEFVQMI